MMTSLFDKIKKNLMVNKLLVKDKRDLSLLDFKTAELGENVPH